MERGDVALLPQALPIQLPPADIPLIAQASQFLRSQRIVPRQVAGVVQPRFVEAIPVFRRNPCEPILQLLDPLLLPYSSRDPPNA